MITILMILLLTIIHPTMPLTLALIVSAVLEALIVIGIYKKIHKYIFENQ